MIANSALRFPILLPKTVSLGEFFRQKLSSNLTETEIEFES